jgi:hypothetical protein
MLTQRVMTVGDLKEALKDVPDHLEVRFDSELVADGEEIVIEAAERITYEDEDYFSISGDERVE